MSDPRPLSKREEADLRRHACPESGNCPVCRLFATLDRVRAAGGEAESEAAALAAALEAAVAVLKKSWTPRGVHAPVGYGVKAMEEAIRKADAALARRRRHAVLKKGSTG